MADLLINSSRMLPSGIHAVVLEDQIIEIIHQLYGEKIIDDHISLIPKLFGIFLKSHYIADLGVCQSIKGLVGYI